MSVIIKGMEMPKNCEECDFCHWSNLHQTGRCDRCDDEPVCADFGTDYKRSRARFCPLVEVPNSHGRLIDADDVKSRMIPLSFSVQKWISEVELSNCKTVIKEEREEHERTDKGHGDA